MEETTYTTDHRRRGLSADLEATNDGSTPDARPRRPSARLWLSGGGILLASFLVMFIAVLWTKHDRSKAPLDTALIVGSLGAAIGITVLTVAGAKSYRAHMARVQREEQL